uniref:Uncharacterized protein n=1 Tax=Amphimedon queenslandica TaxID=400682 RepID=A0A1X7USN6_AMPQE
MINTQLTDDDKNAMVKLTKAFGESFWNYSVFVLTFANLENVARKDDRDADEEEPDEDDEEGWKELEKRRFTRRLELWKKELQSFLVEELKEAKTSSTERFEATRNSKSNFIYSNIYGLAYVDSYEVLELQFRPDLLEPAAHLLNEQWPRSLE